MEIIDVQVESLLTSFSAGEEVNGEAGAKEIEWFTDWEDVNTSKKHSVWSFDE